MALSAACLCPVKTASICLLSSKSFPIISTAKMCSPCNGLKFGDKIWCHNADTFCKPNLETGNHAITFQNSGSAPMLLCILQ